MKVRYGTLLLIGILVIMSQWSCKKNNVVGTGAPAYAEIDGVVYNSSSPTPLAGVKVKLSYGSTVDSVTTDTSGVFRFAIEVADTSTGVDVTLSAYLAGYNTYTKTFNVKTSQQFPIILTSNAATYAVVTGAVQDSTTRYPLRDATVIISLPGGADSTTTLQDGSFSLSVNLFNLNSLSTTITITKDGFKTYRVPLILKKGTDTVGTIYLPINQSETYAHIFGHVADSRNGQPLTNVSVLLSSSIATDSSETLSDGSYSFDLNLQGPSSVSGTLRFRSNGYRDTTLSFSVNAGQTLTQDVALVTTLNYAIIIGTVRDSASHLPLQGANVLISLPGSNASMAAKSAGITKPHPHGISSLVLDSTTTLNDGSFSMAINLVDLSSISATLIVSKAGFVTYQSTQIFNVGTNNLGNIFIQLNSASSIAHLAGHVTDSQTGLAIPNVSVLLSSALKVDSTKTLNDGSYSFDVDLKGLSSTSGTLLFRLGGYANQTINCSLNAGQTTTENALLTPQSSATYANVTGVVRDSTSGYPLAGASVLISLPGSSSSSMEVMSHKRSNKRAISSLIIDSTSTLADGSFTMNINLFDLDSVTATMTVSKVGFVTSQTVRTFQKGTNNLNNIFIQLNSASSVAHLAGHVTDSQTGLAIPNVSVLLSSALKVDSTKTLNDGSYSFDVDLKGLSSTSGTLLFRLSGYADQTINCSLNAGQTTTENALLTPQSSATYANVTGVVRDSTSGYPLAGASVLISLPGSSSSSMEVMSHKRSNKRAISSLIIDSTSTLADGSFTMNINLFDLDSVTATMTVSKVGFVTSQTVRTFQKGTNNLSSIYIKIDVASSIAHVFGYVADFDSKLPITNVAVLLSSAIKVDSTKTLNDGSYSFDEDLKGLASFSGTLRFRLNSYDDTTISFTASAGKSLEEDVVLSPKPTVVGGDSSTARGVARSIALVSVSHQEISVHGVGRNETSLLVWQVLDSLGFPIDINHSDTVVFIPTGIPVSLGGAYVTPTLGVTGGSGQVSTTINSGTTAGTIQLIVKLTLSNGKVVQSSPVLITVDGGLPDQAHFELNSNPPHAHNFAGYDWSEVSQGFTAQAGDKYANPVAPNTAIYFSTTGGIITAAGQTDVTGHTNATLYSGYPLPYISGLDTTYFGSGKGYAFVKAFTQGDSGIIVADSGLICFSGSLSQFSITRIGATDTVHSGGSITYHVHIADEFGNPLESGTTVTTSVILPPPPPGGGGTVWSILPSGDLTATGGGPITLTDNLVRDNYPSTRGSTDFLVTVSATMTQGVPPQVTSFTLTITVQGRNTDNAIVPATISGVAVAP